MRCSSIRCRFRIRIGSRKSDGRRRRGAPTPRPSNAIVHALRQRNRSVLGSRGLQFGAANITVVAIPNSSPRRLLRRACCRSWCRPRSAGCSPKRTRRSATSCSDQPSKLWSAHFGSDPAIVGREIMIDDRAASRRWRDAVAFDFPKATCGIWRPLTSRATARSRYLAGASRCGVPELTDAQVKIA